MADNTDSDPFEHRITGVLNSQVEQYDAGVVKRLAMARQQAVQAVPQVQKHRPATRLFAGAAATAATLMLAGLYLFDLARTTKTAEHEFLAGSMEVILSEEDMEIFESDIEFYVWLEQELEDDNAS